MFEVFYDAGPQDGMSGVSGSSEAVVSVRQSRKVQSLEEVVILSQERGISKELLEVIKQGSLKMLPDQISFVLRVSIFYNATYTIAKMEEMARK